MTNSTQRFFMVKVTECCNCPNAEIDSEVCLHDYEDEQAARYRFTENVQRITPSCPMYLQSQEVEK